MLKNALCKDNVQAVAIDSREVAQMMEVEHKELLKKIRIHIKNLNEGRISLVKYFKESTYKDSKGEIRSAYEITKRGCEYIAHKMTGVKGATFTDRYMDRFEEMEQVLKQPKQLSYLEELRLHYLAIEEQNKEIESVREEVQDLKDNMPLFNIECKELQSLVRSKGMRVLGGYKSPAYNDNSLRGKVYSDIQRQIKREFGVARYEGIKRSQLEIAREIVDTYKAPTVLVAEISALNSQTSLFDKRGA